MHRLKVEEHHNRFNPSEVVRVDIDTPDKVSVVVEHLSSKKCIIVELVHNPPSLNRQRVGQYYYE